MLIFHAYMMMTYRVFRESDSESSDHMHGSYELRGSYDVIGNQL